MGSEEDRPARPYTRSKTLSMALSLRVGRQGVGRMSLSVHASPVDRTPGRTRCSCTASNLWFSSVRIHFRCRYIPKTRALRMGVTKLNVCLTTDCTCYRARKWAALSPGASSRVLFCPVRWARRFVRVWQDRKTAE